MLEPDRPHILNQLVIDLSSPGCAKLAEGLLQYGDNFTV